MVVLAAEILKRMKPFIEDGVHPQLLIRALSKASEEVSSVAISVTYFCNGGVKVYVFAGFELLVRISYQDRRRKRAERDAGEVRYDNTE